MTNELESAPTPLARSIEGHGVTFPAETMPESSAIRPLTKFASVAGVRRSLITPTPLKKIAARFGVASRKQRKGNYSDVRTKKFAPGQYGWRA